MISPSVFSEPRSAYIHVPFCAHRCGYCDFTLVAEKDDLIDDYLSALALEFRSLSRPRQVETLFFGGGTPTHLSAGRLARLLELTFRWFQPVDGCEISIEANPAGLDNEKIDRLACSGVNRISLGVQSFNNSTLELLERDHRQDDVALIVERLQRRITNISLDLIFAVPGQTLTEWQETLKQAIELRPQHISTYGLTFEKGTSFWTRRKNRDLIPLGEELQREMYAVAMDQLTAAGFEQYEISNFARLGFRCRHNEVYWTSRSYYGFGPGAARYINGRRETNHRNVMTWLKRTLAGEPATAECEELSGEDRAREAIMLGLRQYDGIDRGDFRDLTGFSLDQLVAKHISRHCRSGLIEDTGSHIRLTREGRFLADTVIVDFL